MALPPLVGLPTDHKPIGPHPFLAVGEKYVRAVVEGADATPVLLPALQPPVPPGQWLARLDGLLLTGSVSNIEPYHYSDTPTDADDVSDPARDATTLALVPLALAMGLPVLAICRGAQEVNVALGGSLHRRLHEVRGLSDHREDPDDPLEAQYAPAHEVRLCEGGLLAAIAGAPHARVNSLHGQGVDRLAAGLVVEATAEDGLVEAFRSDGGGFLLGVQWHPEWQVTRDPFYLGIFRAFGQACRDHAARRRTDDATPATAAPTDGTSS
ncbi:gamma-glutamyl-gamma-aminobutyrate hydrolase [Pseudoxanthomonas broegbernensis]|uniref:gamma-glutamyl-gamma-aminobutyrate hydrolase n=1 Tax=Pseudoxanthomonas broegbernensis TaxID=83619 RepID=A0A7V8GP86_9GAMM|nr:gamma-glutamyl-gamma-aminobutyrate hydrolase family protein [Pseudoxanthomonas broegbernensis]KAF1687464.1 gamma-glutamyl-gamma-aminobutyrate hydrolase [Pseudoxanthomonas broegbernensis]MBB6064463.1 putative glutamine amidotransferase [Pseudoxanthomonas broegbernensis]